MSIPQAIGSRAALGMQSHMNVLRDAVDPRKARDFFREICRCLPTIVRTYKLEELSSAPELRRNIAQLIRKNAQVQSSNVIDLLVYKGREELEMIMMQHKQRHHIIDRYLLNPAEEKVKKPSEMSPFLESFYKSN